MIVLSPVDQARVDATIDASLDRLRQRAAALGAAPAALAEAAASAAEHGKRLRPALVIAAYRAFADDPRGADAAPPPAVLQVAAAYELLHTGFVVHDDLIDRDLERRGSLNVGGRFRQRARVFGASADSAAEVGDAAAVLAGDLLLFEATRLMATAPVGDAARDDLFALLDDAILVSATGELADVENAARADVPATEELLGAAHDKTATYSFEAPLVAGAILAGAPAGARAALAGAGADLGLAFQLVDDLIGTFGTRRQAGREPGADLRENKRTPLIGLARRTGSWPQVSSALALAHTGPIAVRRAQQELEASGARDDLEALVRTSLARARDLAGTPGLPQPAVALVAALASAIEGRIP